MKTYQRQRVTAIRFKSTLTCDICKEEIKSQFGYENDEVTIEAKLGSVYPEGDQREVASLDCCAKCFENKVRPLIEEQLGLQFRIHDADDFGPRGTVESVVDL